MPEPIPNRFKWSKGYISNTALLNGLPDCLVSGQNVLLKGPDRAVSSKGFGSAVAHSGGVNPLQNVFTGWGGLTGGGSITQAFAPGVYFFAGIGTAFVNGNSVGAVQGGSITIWTGSQAVAAGINPPGAPTISSSGTTGFCNGVFSIACTAIRSLTGGESSVGTPSNAVTVTNQGIVINSVSGFPSVADHLGIYASQTGFGGIGPYYHLYDVAWPQSTPYLIQVPGASEPGWVDSQLGVLAPIDYSLPPACGFCGAINASILALGCYGGAGISASIPNLPESYPVTYVVFVPDGSSITCVKGSGITGALLVGTVSSLNLVQVSNNTTTSPIQILPIWSATGVVSANQLVTYGEEIIAWVGTRGLVKTRRFVSSGYAYYQDVGAEAGQFAVPVLKTFEVNNFNSSNVSLCIDPANGVLWVLGPGIGVPYDFNQGFWYPPVTLPATIVTAVTDIANNRALFSDSSGNLYQPETGTGTTWNLVPQMQSGEVQMYPNTIDSIHAVATANCKADLIISDDLGNININTVASGAQNLNVGSQNGAFHVNVQEVKAWTVELFGTDSGGTEVSGVETRAIPWAVRV